MIGIVSMLISHTVSDLTHSGELDFWWLDYSYGGEGKEKRMKLCDHLIPMEVFLVCCWSTTRQMPPFDRAADHNEEKHLPKHSVGVLLWPRNSCKQSRSLQKILGSGW